MRDCHHRAGAPASAFRPFSDFDPGAASDIAAALKMGAGDVLLRFSDFSMDQERGELRGPDGEAVQLRPKAFSMLALFVANAGRVLSKQELMEAIWPDVHVAEDSLFKCVREIRTVLGDDKRQMIKLVSGRGYLFDAEVIPDAPPAPRPAANQPDSARSHEPPVPPKAAGPALWFRRRVVALVVAATTVVIAGLAIVTARQAPNLSAGRRPVTVAVMSITGTDGNVAATAEDVTRRLSDGLARIDDLRVMAPQIQPQDSSAARPDFVVSGELGSHAGSWEVRARMVRSKTGDVVWTTAVSIAADVDDPVVQNSRLAAAIGEPLAQRINALVEFDARANDKPSSSGDTGVVIQQALASITETTKERFAAAEAMLEKAIAADPGNVDLSVALAALQLRGVQMVWFTPSESAEVQARARAVLKRALKQKPGYLPVLEAYCRFLNATNEFVESLVACARVLSFDPWNGVALFHIGIGQVQLGRFDEALATFKQADSFDTPPTSRWTWKLGAGMTYLLMRDSGNALPWLQRSIAITPATGRSYMLLSAAYEGLGRPDESKAAMEKGMALRPGSNLSNVTLPTKNASPTFIRATTWIVQAYLAAGLPER